MHLSRRDLLVGAAASVLTVPARRLQAESSTTLLLTDADIATHDPGPLIVERRARYRAVVDALSAPPFDGLNRREVSRRDDVEQAVLRAHTPLYFKHLQDIASDSVRLPFAIDADTIMSNHTWSAVMSAVAAGLDAVDHVMQRSDGVRNAFCPVRPPGHHAEASRAMGFCFFSNVAIAALYARARHGAQRIAVVDFDVHHGNGTQRIFWHNKNLFYGSTHEMPLFPGTGAASETGVGNIFNAPLKAGDSGTTFRSAMQERILPALDGFRPDFILISAGFDAHEGDPLAHLKLHEEDFAWVTERIMEAADRHCSGRIVSMLEGGYVLTDLARSVAAHVRTLMQ